MAGCDEGTPTLSATGDGPAPHVIWRSPSPDAMGVGLRQSIRVQFDRYLLPDSAVRQGICVQSASPSSGTNDCPNSVLLAPQYDPVDRVVAWIPQQDLTPNTRYTVRVLAPRSEDDVTGIRAFDGVPLAAEDVFGFTTGSSMTPTLPEPVRDVDYCDLIDLCTLPATVCTPVNKSASHTPGPNSTLATCNAGANCHTPPLAVPFPASAFGNAFVLFGEMGLPTTVQQLVSQSVVATETATGPDPKAPARGAATPFGQNMPYIDGKNPGNSFLLYKVLIGMRVPPAGTFSADYYSCDALRAAGVMTIDGMTCTSAASPAPIPPVLATRGDVIPGAVDPWVPDDQSQPAADGESVRLVFRIRGLPMPYQLSGMPRSEVLTLSAWIAGGAATNNCTP